MINLIKDFKAYSKGKLFFSAFINLGFYITLNYRLGHFFYKIYLYPISKIFWLINRILFSVDINMKAKIAGGFVIHHGIGIVIGSRVIIKGPLNIYQQVTLGGNHGKSKIFNGKKISMPYINNNVSIYPGAKVLGPVIIGENAKIGVNAIVTKDVPSNGMIINTNKLLDA
ncbi:MAG: hypothetical protein V2I54_12500 [Bacteroidales bacterium]|jgi:serine O-acetyltransferase|nr:hypothetical protein [Bacteroidales bacterium]